MSSDVTIQIPASTAGRSPREVDGALHHAAVAAGSAPSIHNTQPWFWRGGRGVLELWADRSRQLRIGDPAGRMLTISCGCALHHALVALAAQGQRTTVVPLPDPTQPDLLARVTVTGNAAIDAATIRMYDAIALRRTDRRQAADQPMDESTMLAIAHAARPHGAFLRFLPPDRIAGLAELVSAAMHAQAANLAWRAELSQWVGGTGRSVGVPDANLPSHPVPGPVPERDFGRFGTLPVQDEPAGSPSYAVLYGEEDTPAGWLCAGQALSAIWLVANELDVSVVPISAVVEVPGTRRGLRELLYRTSWPYLVLRLGLTDPRERGPVATARLSASWTVSDR